jgi:lysophospholipase L1-like esterase
MGIPERRCGGIPAVLNQPRFSSNYSTLVLAIGGDQTQHVLYRLQHGELVPTIKANKQAIFTILIGTNNLGSGMLPAPTVAGVLAVTELVLGVTAGRVILQKLLPRSDSHRLAALCPPRCSSKNTPFDSFMPAVQKVNQALQDSIRDLQTKYPDRLTLVDCGGPFVGSQQEQQVDIRLMPDQLHPNAAGHQFLATCLLDCIEHKTCS